MKTGILTFFEADNYGALLQAYALQETVRLLGSDAVFVNIERSDTTDTTPLSPIAKRILSLKIKRSRSFDGFRDSYLNISKLYRKGDDIDGDHDTFIAGSDQVWNTNIPEVDGRYFLPFASPQKRNSYAASFGEWKAGDRSSEWIAKQLNDFDRISVRERSGIDVVRDLTGRKAIVTVDPVFLLPKSSWEDLTDDAGSDPYVLLFLLRYDPDFVRAAEEEAAKRKVRLVSVSASYIPQLGADAWTETSVTAWLSYIRHAECVFSDSFHAISFCLIFGRPFVRKSLGQELSSRNGRLDELLTLAGCTGKDLSGRLIMPDDLSSLHKLSERTDSSISYLRGIIDHARNM